MSTGHPAVGCLEDAESLSWSLTGFWRYLKWRRGLDPSVSLNGHAAVQPSQSPYTNPLLERSLVPLPLCPLNGEQSIDREKRFKRQILGIKTLNQEKFEKTELTSQSRVWQD